MKTIYKEFKKLDFREYGNFPTFEIYSIEGGSYDFTENLGFPDHQDGVYIFLNKVSWKSNQSETKIIPMYELLYCGKTVDLRHRFDSHHHKHDLKEYKPIYIAVSYCGNEAEITELENRMLSTFHFKFNAPETNKILIGGVSL